MALEKPSLHSQRWLEVAGKVEKEYSFRTDTEGNRLQVRVLRDMRAVPQRVKDGFMGRFFPVNYPHSVSEGYGTYSQYRAVQHFVSAILHVLSTQSLLFAAGLRPTPAQATIVSWVLKDGMGHVGKLLCSSLGARMDAEPKRWRIFADVMYDVGAGLEVLSPLCPSHFLGMAGMANLAKGMALVSARATRLPIYTSFAKEGNLSDLYAKGEAISVLSNIFGMAAGIRLASTVCASTQSKLLLAPILSGIHIYCVSTEMRAAPVNTLNAQRTGMLVGDYVKRDTISTPGELRYRERLILPSKLNSSAGNVRVGAPLQKAIGKPSQLAKLKHQFAGEKFLLCFKENCTDLILHKDATGEDAVRGWLLAACVDEIAKDFKLYSPNDLSIVEMRREGERRGGEGREGERREESRWVKGGEEGNAGEIVRTRQENRREVRGREREREKTWAAEKAEINGSSGSWDARLALEGIERRVSGEKGGERGGEKGGIVEYLKKGRKVHSGTGNSSEILAKEAVLGDALKCVDSLLPPFIEGLKSRGWHTNLFLEGSGIRAIW